MTDNKILTVTLEIEIGEMSDDQLREAGWFSLMEPDEDEEDEDELETPLVDEFGAHEIAGLLPGAISHPDAELFAGSGVFVTLGEVRVTSASWKA